MSARVIVRLYLLAADPKWQCGNCGGWFSSRKPFSICTGCGG
ncbi:MULTISPECIES: hypothetical protein [Actinomycetes]